MHLVNGTGNSPSPRQPTPGVVKQDKSSRGSVDTTKTPSGPQKVRMSSDRRRQRQTIRYRGPVPTPPPQPPVPRCCTIASAVDQPELMQCRGVWVLIHFMRNELTVDIYEMLDDARRLGLELPQDQLGAVRYT